MGHHGRGVDPEASAEDGDGAKHHGEPPRLVAAVVPAVGGGQRPTVADEHTTAQGYAFGTDDGDDETSLAEKSNFFKSEFNGPWVSMTVPLN